jgi:pyruvate dehydrogenase E2 component (dihydrolipoamide acetyltransferase)
MNVNGQWLDTLSTWRKISLNTWSTPDNPTIHGLLEVDVGDLLELLDRRSETSGVKCTMTHAVTRAIAMVLRRYPDANVLVRGRRIWARTDVDIFLQVAMPVAGADDKADLSGAVIRQADTKRVEQIAQELRDRAEAVRAKKDGEMAKTRSMLDRLPGPVLKASLAAIGFLQYDLNIVLPGTPRDPFGSAMVTSVGMFGVSQAFAPLVTFSRCPMVALIGQIEDRAVVRDGAIVSRPMCSISGAFDHRILDGFLAGRVAGALRSLLQKPELLDLSPDEAIP